MEANKHQTSTLFANLLSDTIERLKPLKRGYDETRPNMSDIVALATRIRVGILTHMEEDADRWIATPRSMARLIQSDLSLEDGIRQYIDTTGVSTQFSPANLAAFWYWIIERHRIHLVKHKQPKPWTNDPILRQWFFTNPYRENDKTTEWFRTYIRDPLKNDDEVFMATVIFRWFNFIPTGRVLIAGKTHSPTDPLLLVHQDPTAEEYREHLKQSLLGAWDFTKAAELLKLQRSKHEKVFTGAFMIKPYQTMDKVEGICKCIEWIWKDRQGLLDQIKRLNSAKAMTMEWLCSRLSKYQGLGGFMSYEIVSDLRYTWIAENAGDIHSWANLGPGGMRGTRRLLGLPVEKSLPPNWRQALKDLLLLSTPVLLSLPKIEMREIEHSICEFDKYMRAWEGDGKMKRLFSGK